MPNIVKSRAKKMIDFFGGLIGILILLPLLLGVIIAIFFSMGRPIFFRQQRPGFKENPFEIVKFRTMRPPNEKEIWFRSDKQRLTRIGMFLRKYSIDELPELWNVLKGEMSLVGPRPLLMEYLPYFSEKHRQRNRVKPGITGLAQVSGRNMLMLSERRDLDVEYVENWSIMLDLQIIKKTFFQVLFGKDVISGRTMSDVDDLGLEKAILKAAKLNQKNE